jgi:alkylated DNA repair dioxygenase AlkB
MKPNNSSDKPTVIDLQLTDATVIYVSDFLSEASADEYFQTFLEETPWKQDDITIFGKTWPQPRLTALYGTTDKKYSYSGITMQPLPYTPTLLRLKSQLEEFCQTLFNTVLLNLYRDGNDSNGWHSDDEKELGPEPFIASLSLGAERKFHLKHRSKPFARQDLVLEHASLLIMKGTTQKFWKHQVPKTKKVNTPRINLTFRHLQ